MIVKYPTITLHQGASSIVDFDLSNFDFQGGYVMLTIEDAQGQEIKSQKFTLKGINSVMFTDEFTATLNLGKGAYHYDLMWHVEQERFAQCLPSSIDVLPTVGGYE